jgi:hypothetical protein
MCGRVVSVPLCPASATPPHPDTVHTMAITFSLFLISIRVLKSASLHRELRWCAVALRLSHQPPISLRLFVHLTHPHLTHSLSQLALSSPSPSLPPYPSPNYHCTVLSCYNASFIPCHRWRTVIPYLPILILPPHHHLRTFRSFRWPRPSSPARRSTSTSLSLATTLCWTRLCSIRPRSASWAL